MTQVYKALYSNQPVKVDGKLDDAVWQQTPSYPMHLSKDKTDSSEILQESGQVQFAWDEEYFYLAADFEDSDIIAQGMRDQMHHYQYGDVCELFLKPADETYYWELYVTPAGNKSRFFYPSRGYLSLPDCLDKCTLGLKVGTICNGTLNTWQDKDTGWTAEMAVRVKDLQRYGADFGPGSKWTVLVGRYNYSRYLDETELSMSPRLSKTSFHLYEEYAELEFVKEYDGKSF
jgi:hypothetical protein